MAGSSSNWFRPTKGPLKGQSVYVNKALQEGLAMTTPGMNVRNRQAVRANTLDALSKRTGDFLARHGALNRPANTARTGGAKPRKTTLGPTSSNPQTVARMSQVKKPGKAQDHTVQTNTGNVTVKATMHGDFAVYKLPGDKAWSVSFRHTPGGRLQQYKTKKQALGFTTYAVASGKDFSRWQPGDSLRDIGNVMNEYRHYMTGN
jgi:hypothetical protein